MSWSLSMCIPHCIITANWYISVTKDHHQVSCLLNCRTVNCSI
jgi:hypothetical protein